MGAVIDRRMVVPNPDQGVTLCQVPMGQIRDLMLPSRILTWVDQPHQSWSPLAGRKRELLERQVPVQVEVMLVQVELGVKMVGFYPLWALKLTDGGRHIILTSTPVCTGVECMEGIQGRVKVSD